MKNKRILTDSDGVLVNWSEAFEHWAQNIKGYSLKPNTENEFLVENRFEEDINGLETVLEFNASEYIRNLNPWPGAVENVKKLAEQGYEFHVITAISNEDAIKERREQNLKALFGDVFHAINCVGAFTNKEEYLSAYENSGCWWIEDHPKHAKAGLKYGLNSVLIKSHHNRDFKHDIIHVVDHWDDVYKLIND